MKKLRALHLYLGSIFAPMLIFFAVSGIWQTLGFRSGIFVWLSTIHTEWAMKNGSQLGSFPLRIFVVVMAASFVVSTIFGVAMALKHGSSRKAVCCLACGVILPVVIIFASRFRQHAPSLIANPDSPVQKLAYAAANGEASTVNQLEALCQAASRRPATPSDRGDKLREFRTAFEILGARAGQGNDHAVDALLQAIKLPYLQGFAVDALGEAAGLGNQKALEPLLHPTEFHILPSGAIPALQAAAENGNQKAIEALAAWANDPGLDRKGAGTAAASDGISHSAFGCHSRAASRRRERQSKGDRSPGRVGERSGFRSERRWNRCCIRRNFTFCLRVPFPRCKPPPRTAIKRRSKPWPRGRTIRVFNTMSKSRCKNRRRWPATPRRLTRWRSSREATITQVKWRSVF